MINLNFKLFMALQPTQKIYFKKTDEILTELVFTATPKKADFIIDETNLVRRLKYLKAEKIYIYNIYPFANFEIKQLFPRYNSKFSITLDNPNFELITMDLKQFFNKRNLHNLFFKKNSRLDEHEIVDYSVFIFNQIPMIYIAACFKVFGYLLSPGTTTHKRGLLSPTDARLKDFLTCLEGIY
jgi:hypothetical protein